MQTTKNDPLAHLWYPCSQMKDYQDFPPVMIKSALGSVLTTNNGHEIIDAISSWWCKSLGHRHPRIVNAFQKQLEKYEHIIGTNTVNPLLVTLSEKLSSLHPNLTKVFYGGDGSMAVEIAMKMSIHSRKLLGESERSGFVALKNGYHGETLATLGVSDVGLYKAPYDSHCLPCTYIQEIPYVSGEDDPLWEDCSEFWPSIEKQLDKVKKSTTAIILEPILQGAAGMCIYSADFLKRIAEYAKSNGIHLICDEIMTGFGRTGKALALEHANIQADFICLSKALTAGSLAMSAVVTSDKIYQLFYDDYDTGNAFLHSNTYCGNALAAAVAIEALTIYEEENIYNQAEKLGQYMVSQLNDIQKTTNAFTNVRHIGAMVAADLKSTKKRAGQQLFKLAMQSGAFLRPLGKSFYWLPPLNSPFSIIDKLADITEASLRSLD